ncbi:RuBisCO large subunit C-terminal-like domain-containing protein [Alkalilimnicola ehrlichii MLHE-1]|uniref:Ribulose-1,5-bisphosphate carboxylase/oxygenase large subunit n=1 Tax=Alkalilimnicola ehrlichii (strain ATCC BAA-1101 / DSM 17681 / MLHE-1) TaxID=187272 RepID=Q0A9H0_ALKEH|nr:RuBisCO large subunit C-terminal-like domain-containing protein [Alkalilimnicola ehrlichii]ABI56517.1 ribulose-1,5-bisphosphate carboxylase/oxygenase large subunit [Alkalilimnicola ehrlichii MLHE-1]
MTDVLTATYELYLAEGESPEGKARGIALEQTVEMPADCLPGDIAERMVGRIRTLEPRADHWVLEIDYPLAAIGGELTQCLNLLFGNISLQSGIRLVQVAWPPSLLRRWGGPGLGVSGLRARLDVGARPLLCAALKPMGLSAPALAARCAAFARGGVDLIKDDHGLADQPDAPFAERLNACQDAVRQANRRSGGRSLYLPNVTAAPQALGERLAAARDAGCEMVLISPWLTGLETLRWARDEYGLALMAHPAMTGGLFLPRHGISPALLLGELFRIAGADAVIYPNVGGRFRFSADTCQAINHALRRPLEGLASAWPTPGGGVDVKRAGHWKQAYGPDTILLIGGSLYAQGDIEAASRALMQAIRD